MAVVRAAARGELAHAHRTLSRRRALAVLRRGVWCCYVVSCFAVVFALLVNFMRELTRTHYAPTDISPPPRTSAPHRGPMRWTAPRSARRARPPPIQAHQAVATARARRWRGRRGRRGRRRRQHRRRRAAEGGGGEGGSGSEVRRGGPRLDLYAAFAARGGCHD